MIGENNGLNVDTRPDGSLEIVYTKEDGSYLKATASAIDHVISINYITADNAEFFYTSDGENFIIQGLVEGSDSLEATDDQSIFATFVKAEPVSVLNFVKSGLTFNIKTIELECPGESSTDHSDAGSSEHVDEYSD